MDHCFGSTKPAYPPVEKIVGIERDSEEIDAGIVPSSKKDQWDHIHHGETPRTAAKLGENGGLRLIVVEIGAVDKVGREVGHKDQRMKARGESADVHGTGKHDFLVVPFSVKRSIQKMFLEPRPYSRLIRLPVCEVCGAWVETEEMAEMSIQYLPKPHDQNDCTQ